MLDDSEPKPSIEELRQQYEEERLYQEDRASAEYAYALAVRLRENGETEEARKYANACLQLAKAMPARSLDEVTSDRQTIGGVPMPDYFHEGVVRSRLADLLDAA
ncbi:hypothetical protein [Catenuloplanes atrovinosus]|uniref:Tetratricopeptide repeat protein n=1 Tax=Catenuloplanes atrovinosus TaxID=137266 RepID=A0AAE4CE96_9ACTN|nr:hypothetical protein [Catenuloplanes atrovinosus]MDR7278385.1 hypothetical protein [Catenuloplanes atrovinosus]